MSKYLIEAVVLKATNYKDADKIYTLFAKDLGKISAMAKGVRKISSRRAGNLDTLNHVKLGITEYKDIKIIDEAKTLNSFKDLKNSLDNSLRGFYIAELIHRFLDDYQEQNDIFNLVVDSLSKLNTNLDNESARINHFEIKLMDLLGYGMYLTECAKTGKVFDGTWDCVKFNFALGGFVSDAQSPGIVLSTNAANLLYELKTKNRINKELLSDKKVIFEVNEIIKSYVENISERKSNVTRMFGHI